MTITVIETVQNKYLHFLISDKQENLTYDVNVRIRRSAVVSNNAISVGLQF